MGPNKPHPYLKPGWEKRPNVDSRKASGALLPLLLLSAYGLRWPMPRM